MSSRETHRRSLILRPWRGDWLPDVNSLAACVPASRWHPLFGGQHTIELKLFLDTLKALRQRDRLTGEIAFPLLGNAILKHCPTTTHGGVPSPMYSRR